MLKSLERRKSIKVWYDRQIPAGSDWRDEIERHLSSADIFILFVTRYFLASDFCGDIEIPRALERYDRKEATLVPIIVRACDYKAHLLGGFEAIPKDKAVFSWDNMDEAWLEVSISLGNAIDVALLRKLEKRQRQKEIERENETLDLFRPKLTFGVESARRAGEAFTALDQYTGG